MEAHGAAIELGTGVKVLIEWLWGPGYLQLWRVMAQEQLPLGRRMQQHTCG